MACFIYADDTLFSTVVEEVLRSFIWSSHPQVGKAAEVTLLKLKAMYCCWQGQQKKNHIISTYKRPNKKTKKNHLNITALPCRQTVVSNEELEPLSYFLRSHLTFLHKFYLTERGNCWSTNASIGFVCYRVT